MGSGKKKTGGAQKKRKLHVSFDPDARKEWLTGFRKRKQERRKFGLDMQRLKEKKMHMEEKKANRALLKPYLQEIDEELRQKEEENEAEAAQTEEQVFADSQTLDFFGDSVTVTTSFGLPGEEDELPGAPMSEEDETDDDGDAQESEKFTRSKNGKKDRQQKEQEKTMFQRIQEKSKGKALPKKRKRGKTVKKLDGTDAKIEIKHSQKAGKKKGKTTHKDRRKRK